MHDVVEFEGVIGVGEALNVEWVVLVADDGDADDHLLQFSFPFICFSGGSDIMPRFDVVPGCVTTSL